MICTLTDIRIDISGSYAAAVMLEKLGLRPVLCLFGRTDERGRRTATYAVPWQDAPTVRELLTEAGHWNA